MLDLKFKNKVIITAVILITVIFLSKLMNKKINDLKIAYSYFETINELDPISVKDIYQANLIENLYVRLFEYDNNGNLNCSLCSKYEVKDNYLRLKIRNDFKTIDNRPVGARDAANSLLRLIRTRSNTHGELKYFIDNEESIFSENDYLVIKMKKSDYVQFILPILTSMDYSIIPVDSIGLDNKINDYRNSSGPYYFDFENEDRVVIKANPYHFNYSSDMPQVINIIRTQNQDAVDKFERNEVDLIDVTMYPRSSLYRKLFQKNQENIKSFKTLPMNLLYLGISPSARKNFTKDELFYACKKIKEIYLKFDTFGYGYEDAYQFFQGSGNGQLDDVDLKKLVNARNKEITYTNTNKIKLGVLKRSYEKVKDAFAEQELIEIVSYDSDPAFLDPKIQPDIFIQTTDSSFTEDINVISYNLNAGTFGLNKKESDNWMLTYLGNNIKANRIEMIKKLQLQLLNQPSLCPVVVSPYWAIYRDNLELNFPTQFPGSHWWKIRKL